MNQDGGARGLFVRAAVPPPIGTDLTVAFVLPDGSDLALPGRVVHRLAAEEAQAMGEHAGMGVQFTHMSEEQALRIQELMANAEARASMRASQPVGANSVQAAARPASAAKAGAQSQNNMQVAAKPAPAAANGAHAASTATPANGQVRRPLAGAPVSALPLDPRLHQAGSMLERGRFDGAARLVGELLADNPDLVAGKVLANLIDARRLRAQFAFEDAIAHYQAVLMLDPEHREASEQLVVLPQELEHSVKLYERVFGSKP